MSKYTPEHMAAIRARQVARKTIPHDTCSDCGRPGGHRRRTWIEVHHVDGNPYNNDPANLLALCQRCHMKAHGKMNGTKCSVPGCPGKYAGRGYCQKHYLRFKKHGSPHLIERSGPKKARGVCSIEGCGRPHRARGWCEMHYLRFRSHGDPLVVAKPGPKPRKEA